MSVCDVMETRRVGISGRQLGTSARLREGRMGRWLLAL